MLDPRYVELIVSHALDEDVGPGDLTAALTPNTQIRAFLITRQSATLCGCAFFTEVFRRLDSAVMVVWQSHDGASLVPDQRLCTLTGPARPILTGERAALNLLQTLSGTATTTRRYVDAVRGTGAKVLDTRKTIPGLRLAQKYAVRCGGGHNHRIGLYDGILIKENHLRSGETIAEAVTRGRAAAPRDCVVEIEVTDLAELDQALEAGAQRVLLDNFSIEELRRAVAMCRGRAALEASGGINLENVRAVAETGVDFISVGALTKNISAVDLSLQFER